MSAAIVIGGGIAGMSAAKVLTEFFDKVIVLERDRYPDGIGDRRGVPHGKMFHTLLERGRREIEDILPGFHKLLDERKIPKVSFGFNCALMTARGWGRNAPVPSPRSLFCSRGLLETTMRDLFIDDPGVEIVQEFTVTGLVTEKCAEGLTCIGVIGKRKGGVEPERIDGDLVLDASGGNSKAAAWLKDIGLAPPREETLDPLLTYGGQHYRMKEGAEFPRDWWWTHGAFIQRVPPDDNSAAHLLRQEAGIWLLTLVAGDGHEVPTDEAGIRAFLDSMRSPLIGDMLPYFEPIDELTTYRLPKNRWKHYESWSETLHGFVAIGASTCVFNPNQGQGMSVAAGDAGILKRCLQKTTASETLPKLFFKKQAHFQKNAYQLAVSNDLRFRAVAGRRPAGTRAFNWYRAQLTHAAAADGRVARQMGEVDLLLKPVRSLYNPIIIGRAMFARVFLGWRAKPSPSERVAPRPPDPALIIRRCRSLVRDWVGNTCRLVKFRLGLAR